MIERLAEGRIYSGRNETCARGCEGHREERRGRTRKKPIGDRAVILVALSLHSYVLRARARAGSCITPLPRREAPLFRRVSGTRIEAVHRGSTCVSLAHVRAVSRKRKRENVSV